jgi:hypothetical protein
VTDGVVRTLSSEAVKLRTRWWVLTRGTEVCNVREAGVRNAYALNLHANEEQKSRTLRS